MTTDLIEQAARVLAQHKATGGMHVAFGVICTCGYWTGNEKPGITRPPGFTGLTWHQAQVLSDAGLLTNPTEHQHEPAPHRSRKDPS